MMSLASPQKQVQSDPAHRVSANARPIRNDQGGCAPGLEESRGAKIILIIKPYGINNPPASVNQNLSKSTLARGGTEVGKPVTQWVSCENFCFVMWG
jgi:hypothetical protein